MRYRVFVGLGSNRGNRELMLRRACAELDALPLTQVQRRSAAYETSPVLRRKQPGFLNAAVELRTALLPPELLPLLKEAERRLGRKSGERWGPREIDLDILLYEGVSYRDDRLSVPHEDLARRAFALVPLSEIARDVVHPLMGKSVGELAASCDRTGVWRRMIL